MKTMLPCLCALLLLAACAPAPKQEAAARKPDLYFEPTLLPPTFLAAPMAPGSKQWKQEQAVVRKAHTHASAADRKEIAAEEHTRPDLVTAILGDGYGRAERPATYHLLDKADDTCEAVVHADKAYWHTPRPYVEMPAIKPLVPALNNGSYPSGHATCGMLAAHILGQLIPARRDILDAKAGSIAWHRVMAGVHYPEDLRAGEQLSFMLYGALQQTPAFRADLAAARREAGGAGDGWRDKT